MSYDRLGRLSWVSDATGSRTFSNTDDGQIASETFGADSIFFGGSASHGFDEFLRINMVSVQPPGGAAITQTITYDAASRYETFTQGSSSATYTYDPNSSLIAGITMKNSGTTTLATSKVYDHLNRLKSISNVVGSQVVSSHAYTYNNANQRIRATLVDGSYWVYTYDERGQVIGGNHYWSDGQPVAGQQFGYEFDGIGNRIRTSTNGRTEEYAPNNLNQYTQKKVSGTADVIGTADPTATVTVNSQRASRHGAYFASSVTASNDTEPVNVPVDIHGVKLASGTSDLVTSSTGSIYFAKTQEVFTHDLDGNLIEDGRWHYTWDAENRLITMETGTAALSSGTSVVTKQKLDFKYDWQGRRFEKIVFQWNSAASTWNAISTTRFLYDGWNLVAELDGVNNAILRRYFWGLDLSGSPQGAGGVGGLLSMSITGSNAGDYAAIFDGNGNVMELSTWEQRSSRQ